MASGLENTCPEVCKRFLEEPPTNVGEPEDKTASACFFWLACHFYHVNPRMTLGRCFAIITRTVHLVVILIVSVFWTL